MTRDEALAWLRRWPELLGVWWTGRIPGRGRLMCDDGQAPPVIEVLASEWYESLSDDLGGGELCALDMRARALAACSPGELEALLTDGPAWARAAAVLELGRRAP